VIEAAAGVANIVRELVRTSALVVPEDEAVVAMLGKNEV